MQYAIWIIHNTMHHEYILLHVYNLHKKKCLLCYCYRHTSCSNISHECLILHCLQLLALLHFFYFILMSKKCTRWNEQTINPYVKMAWNIQYSQITNEKKISTIHIKLEICTFSILVPCLFFALFSFY
jgi:hypothetical protein